MPQRPSAYSSALVALHWLTALLVAVVFAAIELRSQFPRGSAVRVGLKELHYLAGLAVFALLWLRLAIRLRHPAPASGRASLPQAAATITHALLYLFMAAMPLLGWALVSAEEALPVIAGVRLPALVGPDPALAERLEGWHEALGTAGYFLIGLHAVAALAHHYVLRDDTLRRMLPGWRN